MKPKGKGRSARPKAPAVSQPLMKALDTLMKDPGPDPYAGQCRINYCWGNRLTAPARAFLEDIRNTCVKHGLVLTVSQYDALQVWPISDDSVARLMDAEDRTPANQRDGNAGPVPGGDS